MEEEKIELQKEAPHKKRRVSLFKRRKKSQIRPFVQAHKSRKYKKVLVYFFIFLLFIVALSGILYLVRFVVIERIFRGNSEILVPVGATMPDDNAVKGVIESQRMDVSNIRFATESGVVTFVLNKVTAVYLTKEKDILTQMKLVEAIDRQVTTDGKRAITIDLRYNKAIVKF